MPHPVSLLLVLGLACQPGGPPVVPAPPGLEATPSPASDAPAARSGSASDAAKTPATLPLAVGHRWTFVAEVRTGAGLRVLGFPTEPARTEILGTRTLEVVSQDEDTGRFVAAVTQQPLQGAPTSASVVLWNDARGTWMLDETGAPVPALLAGSLPDPLTTETVPCDVALLGVQGGRCAALPGGPRNTAPGLLAVAVSEGSGLKPLGQLLVGVLTAGFLVPGNRTPVQVLELQRFSPAAGSGQEPPQPDPFVDAVDAAGAGVSAETLSGLVRQHHPGAEALAAALLPVRNRAALEAVLPEALASVPEADRHRLLRAVLRHRLDAESVALFLSSRPHLPLPLAADQQAALARAVPGREALLSALLAEDQPFVMAWLAAGRGDADAGMLDTVPIPLRPSAAERSIVLSQLPFDDARRSALAAFLSRAPEAEHPAIFVEAFGTLGFDSARVETLEAHGPLVASLSADQRAQVLAGLGFDGGRQAALSVLLAHAPAADHPALFLEVYRLLGFDAARLALASTHPDLVARLSAADKQAVLQGVRFQREEMDALLTGAE